MPSEQLFRWSSDVDSLLTDSTGKTTRIAEHRRARAIVAQPETWTKESAEGLVCLSPSDPGPSDDFRQLWLDAVDSPS